MGTKAGFPGAVTAALGWTAVLLVVQGLPLEGAAAQWRFRAVLLAAWLLGLMVLWLRFRGSDLKWPGSLKGRRTGGIVDPATGLPDRSSFLETVQKQMDSCGKQDEEGLVVLVCVRDIDRIAASHGDDEAEQVMGDVAGALFDSFRGADTLGRHDKDELVAYLPRATSLCWDSISRRIHRNVAARDRRDGKTYSVRVSTGHSEFDPASPLPMEILLRRAYEEMIRDMGKDES